MNNDYLLMGIPIIISLVLAYVDLLYGFVGAIVTVLIFTNLLFKIKENKCHSYYKANFDKMYKQLDEFNKKHGIVKIDESEITIIDLHKLASAQHDAWRNLEENKDSKYNIPFDETPLDFQERNIIRVKAILLKLNELKHSKGD